MTTAASHPGNGHHACGTVRERTGHLRGSDAYAEALREQAHRWEDRDLDDGALTGEAAR